jgi:hypothetical protein
MKLKPFILFTRVVDPSAILRRSRRRQAIANRRMVLTVSRGRRMLDRVYSPLRNQSAAIVNRQLPMTIERFRRQHAIPAA